MVDRSQWCKSLITVDGYHKGFYNDDINGKSLADIEYNELFEENDIYGSAHDLLSGSCEHFAVALNRLLNYDVYVIENTKSKRYHAFCLVYRMERCYYIDARGITTSFDEFMKVASNFVGRDYIIRPASKEDISDWEDCDYNKEAYEFAEYMIDTYKECYVLE